MPASTGFVTHLINWTVKGHHKMNAQEKLYLRRTDARIDSERKSFIEIRRLAKLYSETALPLAHIGDGNCGFVLSLIFDELISAGLYSAESRQGKSVKSKAKISHELQKLVFERDEYRCKHCGTHLKLTVDHIHPESKGGALDMENLQTLCASCNSKKGTKSMELVRS